MYYERSRVDYSPVNLIEIDRTIGQTVERMVRIYSLEQLGCLLIHDRIWRRVTDHVARRHALTKLDTLQIHDWLKFHFDQHLERVIQKEGYRKKLSPAERLLASLMKF